MIVNNSPMVPDAAFVVSCRCGYAYDSNAETIQDAIVDVAKRGHKCADMAFKAVPYQCDDCEKPIRIHQRALVVYGGHNVALCKKCLLKWAKTGVR